MIVGHALLNKVPVDRDESCILKSHILFMVVETFIIFLHPPYFVQS